MTSESDLAETVEGLYRAFAKYPLRASIPSCEHCSRDDAPLRGVPLRERSEDLLSAYAGWLLTTWGEVEELKHLLPRLLEIHSDPAGGAFALMDPEVTYGKLRLAAWRTWPAREQEAIERHAAAWWAATLARYPSEPKAIDVLAALAQAFDDLTPFLRAWEADASYEAQLHRLETLEDETPSLRKKRRLGNGWWKTRPEQEAQAIAWLEAVRSRSPRSTGSPPGPS